MTAWVLWLVAAGMLAAGEIAGGALVLLMLAGGALGGAVAALAGAPVPFQLVAFLGLSAFLLASVRPVARAHLERAPAHRDGVQALVGRTAVVTRVVGRSSGRIQVGADEWTARSEFDDTYPVGTTVRILQVEGATAIVGEEIG
ncbi:NfeD family protein [Geodermatophilus sp. FMUSA9-8]|uniref:NfeD family protein n=1 Tax=Geodermatophilus sp. FMUSA9-8 TaxID=3120155 RepID=UPI00300A636B